MNESNKDEEGGGDEYETLLAHVLSSEEEDSIFQLWEPGSINQCCFYLFHFFN